MLAGFGALTATTVSNQPKPLVDMSGWKPHIPPEQTVYYCIQTRYGSYIGFYVDKHGVTRSIPCPYKYP